MDSGQEGTERGWVLPGPTWGLSSMQDGGSARRGPLGQASALGAHLSLYLGSNVSCTTLIHPGGKGGGERGKGPGPLDTPSFNPASGTGMGQRLTCTSTKAPTMTPAWPTGTVWILESDCGLGSQLCQR